MTKINIVYVSLKTLSEQTSYIYKGRIIQMSNIPFLHPVLLQSVKSYKLIKHSEICFYTLMTKIDSGLFAFD